MMREEARRQARLSAGRIDPVKEACREERGVQQLKGSSEEIVGRFRLW
jgi:hypothetical protein